MNFVIIIDLILFPIFPTDQYVMSFEIVLKPPCVIHGTKASPGKPSVKEHDNILGLNV